MFFWQDHVHGFLKTIIEKRDDHLFHYRSLNAFFKIANDFEVAYTAYWPNEIEWISIETQNYVQELVSILAQYAVILFHDYSSLAVSLKNQVYHFQHLVSSLAFTAKEN